jgi:hypothetical protein
LQIEVTYRFPHQYNSLKSNFDSQIYNNSILIYVRPNSVSDDEQARIQSLLSESMAMVSEKRITNPQIRNIEYTWSDFADLPEEFQE